MLFGDEYAPAVVLTRVLVVFLFVNTLIAIPSSVLLTWEKYSYVVLSAAIASGSAGVPCRDPTRRRGRSRVGAGGAGSCLENGGELGRG